MTYNDQVREFIITNFLFGDSAKLDNAASLLDKGIIDSTGILEVVGFLEKTFQFTVGDDELLPENLDSVNNLVAYIAKKLPAKAS